MSAAVPALSFARRLQQAVARHGRALGALMVAWASSWNSLACDPEIDVHIYPFF